MNRRSFLKSAALAAVAVPVVGLPAMPVAKVVPVKPDRYTVRWDGITSKGVFTTPDLHSALYELNWHMRHDQEYDLRMYKHIQLYKNGDLLYDWC